MRATKMKKSANLVTERRNAEMTATTTTAMIAKRDGDDHRSHRRNCPWSLWTGPFLCLSNSTDQEFADEVFTR